MSIKDLRCSRCGKPTYSALTLCHSCDTLRRLEIEPRTWVVRLADARTFTDTVARIFNAMNTVKVERVVDEPAPVWMSATFPCRECLRKVWGGAES